MTFIPTILPDGTSPAPAPFPPNIEYESNTARAELLSGVEINQNTPPTLSTDYIVCSGSYYYQQFILPETYARGGTVNPDITGIQACVNLAPTTDFAIFDTVLLASGINTVVTSGIFGITTSGVLPANWQFLTSGTAVGCHANGERIWADVYFDTNVPITDQLANATFAVGLQTTNVAGWNYSQPNPYAGGAAYQPDNTTPLSPASSFMFRLLSYSADAGVDWLGDNYRNVVINQEANNISTFGTPNPDYYWLSKPNPSKYAVESLYFDISDEFGNPQTIDKILMAPITQGPVFHVYWSIDGLPVTSASDWDNKLWTPVAQTYRLTQRNIFALPFPVTANYIKIEFSRLQAQYYNPGTFSQSVIYNKFPIWLYNYFMPVPPVPSDANVTSAINVVYNKLQLAFDYYLDDLMASPIPPSQLQAEPPQSLPSSNVANTVTPQTLAKINTQLAPFTLPIGATVTGQSVLSQFLRSTVNTFNYPVESLQAPTAVNTTVVSVPERTAIVQQENQPNLYFFLTCRHAYQQTQADFEYNRAYFVGLSQVAFLREDYSIPFDSQFYVEAAGDIQNAYLNDFEYLDNVWQVLDVDQF